MLIRKRINSLTRQFAGSGSLYCNGEYSNNLYQGHLVFLSQILKILILAINNQNMKNLSKSLINTKHFANKNIKKIQKNFVNLQVININKL
jgi:uncharacterized protein YlbG (UPF0298 family)